MRCGRKIRDYDRAWRRGCRCARASPCGTDLLAGQVMATLDGKQFVDGGFCITPRIWPPFAHCQSRNGRRADIARFGEGIAIGSGIARTLGAQVGRRIA